MRAKCGGSANTGRGTTATFFLWLDPGPYYVRVRPYSSSYNTTYNLTLAETPKPDSLGRADNTLSGARELGVLNGVRTVNDFVGTSDVEDYYRFTVTVPVREVTFLLENVTECAWVQLIGAAVLGSANTGMGTTATFSRWLDPGTYYVRVWPYRSGDSTTYDLTLAIPPTPTPTPSPFTLVTGVISDAETGKPVSGATVQIDGGVLRVFTDAQGRFRMFAHAGQYQLQVWGFAYEFKTQNITVPQSGTLDVGTILLRKITGAVVGRLVDNQSGDPLAEATVQLDGGQRWRTYTDKEGYFLLINVTPGNHTLQAWGYAYTFQQQTIDVKSQGPSDVGELAFYIIPETVIGQVLDERTGRPILGAQVQYDGGGLGRETKTNITGRFILVNVPQGYYELQVWGWAYCFTVKPFTHYTGTCTNAGHINLRPIGGTVSGRLVDSVNGLPVYNGTVQLNGGSVPSLKTQSVINGDFILYDVLADTHQLQTWSYAYRFYTRDITTTSGGEYPMGDVAMTPDPNTFNGRVLDAQTRLPIEDAEVILTNGHERRTTSFPDGRFVLLNVPEGTYRITVDAPGYEISYFRSAHPGNNLNVELGDVLLMSNP